MGRLWRRSTLHDAHHRCHTCPSKTCIVIHDTRSQPPVQETYSQTLAKCSNCFHNPSFKFSTGIASSASKPSTKSPATKDLIAAFATVLQNVTYFPFQLRYFQAAPSKMRKKQWLTIFLNLSLPSMSLSSKINRRPWLQQLTLKHRQSSNPFLANTLCSEQQHQSSIPCHSEQHSPHSNTLILDLLRRHRQQRLTPKSIEKKSLQNIHHYIVTTPLNQSTKASSWNWSKLGIFDLTLPQW